eukprot:6670107-Alexandrium_andersonii.AAC.1
MSASLVGSEMCIRDRLFPAHLQCWCCGAMACGVAIARAPRGCGVHAIFGIVCSGACMRKCATYPCSLAFGRMCSSTSFLFEVWWRDSHALVVRCLRSFAY